MPLDSGVRVRLVRRARRSLPAGGIAGRSPVTTMQFALPIGFALAVLIALPLLLSRWQPPRERRPIGNLYLWPGRRSPVDGAHAHRRRRLSAVVILQMLAIATIVLAIARPSVVTRTSRITFVFDVSASMGALAGGETRLTRARSLARATVRRLAPTARVRVIVAAASPRDLGEYSAA